jgi:hypothetical protein
MKVLVVERVDLRIAGVRFALQLSDDLDDHLPERAADPVV